MAQRPLEEDGDLESGSDDSFEYGNCFTTDGQSYDIEFDGDFEIDPGDVISATLSASHREHGHTLYHLDHAVICNHTHHLCL